MVDGIPVLTPLADRLEDLLVRRFRGQYRRVVQGLTVLSVLLVVVAGVLFLTDQAGLDAGTYSPLLQVTGAVVSLFVLLGVLQFLLLARAVDRTAGEVTAAAEEVETGADEVVEAADTVEAGADEVETAAEDVETAAKDVETVADDVEAAAEETGAPTDSPRKARETGEQAEKRAGEAQERGETAKESAEHAKDAGEKAKDVASEAKERLGPRDVVDAESEAGDEE